MRRLLPLAALVVACAKKPPPRPPSMAPDDEPALTAAESNAQLGIAQPPSDEAVLQRANVNAAELDAGLRTVDEP